MTKELTLDKAATKIHAANNKFGKQFSEWVVIVGEQLRKTQEQLASHKAGFETWCKTEFDWSTPRVYQIMNAADTVLLTSTIVEVAPSNEAQCRELLKAPKEDIPEVWRDVVDSAAGATITAKMITERIQKRIDASKPKPPATPDIGPQKTPASVPQITAQTKQVESELQDVVDHPQETNPVVDHVEPEVSDKIDASIVRDALDREIPQKFRSANELSVTLLSIGREVDKFRQRAKELKEQPGGEWIRLQEIDEHVRALKGHFQEARYHTVCHQCKGSGCQQCEQNGWVPEFRKNTVL